MANLTASLTSASTSRRQRYVLLQIPEMATLPERMFELGKEPVDKKVNIYYSLRYLEVIKCAIELEPDLRRKLMDSQFGKLIEAGNKITSSVRFIHFLLCRQLVTKKRHEIWCVFAGQPFRFSIREFALVTGLNCSELPAHDEEAGDASEITKTLFGKEKNPTLDWIMNTLLAKQCKDKDTMLRLACVLLVDGVLCPSSNSKKARIDGDHILMVKDVDSFLAYPWGRRSFNMTMDAIKGRSSSLSNLCQPSCALQGFAHALQMVALACAPLILMPKEVDEAAEEVPSAQKPISIFMPRVKSLDKAHKVCDVQHIMEEEEEGDSVIEETEISWSDEEEDASVDHMLESIYSGVAAFTTTSWIGGARVIDHINPTRAQTTTTVDPASSFQKVLESFAAATKASATAAKASATATNALAQLKHVIRNFALESNMPCDFNPTPEQNRESSHEEETNAGEITSALLAGENDDDGVWEAPPIQDDNDTNQAMAMEEDTNACENANGEDTDDATIPDEPSNLPDVSEAPGPVRRKTRLASTTMTEEDGSRRFKKVSKSPSSFRSQT